VRWTAQVVLAARRKTCGARHCGRAHLGHRFHDKRGALAISALAAEILRDGIERPPGALLLRRPLSAMRAGSEGETTSAFAR
jgi:hypothetical protein